MSIIHILIAIWLSTNVFVTVRVTKLILYKGFKGRFNCILVLVERL